MLVQKHLLKDPDKKTLFTGKAKYLGLFFFSSLFIWSFTYMYSLFLQLSSPELLGQRGRRNGDPDAVSNCPW